MRLIECVPNFSEGRDPRFVQAIRDAIAAVEGAVVLDVSSDPSHHRTVITFVAALDRAVDAAFAGMREAAARIDLTTHQGEHPRIGATDVVPFLPLEGTTMEDCIALARALGERAARELRIPVYLYERAATRPDRVNLADVRRGEFEGLRGPSARAVLDVRSTPGWTHAELAAAMRQALDVEVVVTSDRLVPCETPPDSALLRAAGRVRPAGRQFGSPTCSDWVFLRDRDALKCGPGTSRRTHTADEHVDLAEVTEARAFYHQLAQSYLA